MDIKSNFGIPFDQGFYSRHGNSGFVLGPRQTLFSFAFETEAACNEFLGSSKIYIGMNLEDDHFVRLIVRADMNRKITVKDHNFLVNPQLLGYSPIFMQPESCEVYFYASLLNRPDVIAGIRGARLDPHFAQTLRAHLYRLERGTLSTTGLVSLYSRRMEEEDFGLEYSEVMNGKPLFEVTSAI